MPFKLPPVNALGLPVFNGDVMGSLVGVMLFPNDLMKAQNYACWHAGRACAKAGPSGVGILESEGLTGKILLGATSHENSEAEKALYAGSQAAFLVHYLWTAIQSHPDVTWEDATKAGEALGSRPIKSLAR